MIRNKRLWGILVSASLAIGIGAYSYLRSDNPEITETPQTTVTIDEILENSSDNSFENTSEEDRREEIISPQNKWEEYFRRKESAKVRREIKIKEPNNQSKKYNSQEEEENNFNYNDEIEEEKFTSSGDVLKRLYEHLEKHDYYRAEMLISVVQEHLKNEPKADIIEDIDDWMKNDVITKILKDYENLLTEIENNNCENHSIGWVIDTVSYMGFFLRRHNINENRALFDKLERKGEIAKNACTYK